jgi:hypothetical protein
MELMKNLLLLFVVLGFLSCKKDEEVKPWYNWDRSFGPYNRISADSIPLSNSITLNGNPYEIVSVISYTSDTSCRVHIKANINLFSTGDFKYFLAINDIYRTISEHDIYGGVNGFPKLEIDNIDLKKGDVVHCYVGYTRDKVMVSPKGSYLLVERY